MKRRLGKVISYVSLGASWRGMGKVSRRSHRQQRRIDRRQQRREGERITEQEVRWAGAVSYTHLTLPTKA